jgi:hypothetical protein
VERDRSYTYIHTYVQDLAVGGDTRLANDLAVAGDTRLAQDLSVAGDTALAQVCVCL